MKTNEEGRKALLWIYECSSPSLRQSRKIPQQLCESLEPFRPPPLFILREPDLAGRDPPVQLTVQRHERLALRVHEEEGVGDGGQVEALPPQPLLLPFERAWNAGEIGFPSSDDDDISVADKRNDKRLLRILN